MFAIVNIQGQQFKVKANDTIYVNRLKGEVGDKVEFNEVLMTSNEGKTSFAQSAVVKAEILAHLKGEKVLIFKKKRRKGYQKLNGHRQALTQIKISELT